MTKPDLTDEEADTLLSNALNQIADLIDDSESDIVLMRAKLRDIADIANSALAA